MNPRPRLEPGYVTGDLSWDEFSGRGDPEQRYQLYRVCPGETTKELLATCATEAAVGVTLCTLGREGELTDCANGCLDTMPECLECAGQGVACPVCKGSGVKPTGTWLWRPWRAMPKEVSAAGRVLGSARKRQ